ncbi:hypothetical protein LCGC14_0981650 [marine sediment metagenome]|uniref:HTH cro/C1-type domain-containing protein n=1 Tax=marine sediment metagenome TaxID=412755 RepID=A0A0F8Y4Y7_9ZZZZ
MDEEGRLRSAMSIPPVILEGLKKDHGSINAAARAMGMPQATLHNIVGGEGTARLDQLQLIARDRKMPLWELVRLMQAGEEGAVSSH